MKKTKQRPAASRGRQLCLTANSACSACVLSSSSCSCCCVMGRFADSRYSLAAASLGVTTATFTGSTEPSADMSSTRETLEPRLEETADAGEDGDYSGGPGTSVLLLRNPKSQIPPFLFLVTYIFHVTR